MTLQRKVNMKLSFNNNKKKPKNIFLTYLIENFLSLYSLKLLVIIIGLNKINAIYMYISQTQKRTLIRILMH